MVQMFSLLRIKNDFVYGCSRTQFWGKEFVGPRWPWILLCFVLLRSPSHKISKDQNYISKNLLQDPTRLCEFFSKWGEGILHLEKKMHDFYLHGFWLIFIKFPLHIWVSRINFKITVLPVTALLCSRYNKLVIWKVFSTLGATFELCGGEFDAPHISHKILP